MKLSNLTQKWSILMLFTLCFCAFSTILFAQRNVNPYKNKEKTVVVDEEDVYDPTKDQEKNRNELHLKDSAAAEGFADFVKNVNVVKTPYNFDEESNKKSFKPVSMATYDKYFNIYNGIGEQVMIEPKGKNRLYLIGKLDKTPRGTTALLFYGYDGAIFQFTKIITFDKTGVPIAEQNVQFYIDSNDKRREQVKKMTCQLNRDNTMSCITYANDESKNKMKPEEGTIYKVGKDGSIKEVGIVDIERMFGK